MKFSITRQNKDDILIQVNA